MTTPFTFPAGTAVDRLDALDALLRFGAGQDLRDEALLASAFTEDATLDFTQPAARFGVPLAVFAGRATIVATVFANTAPLATTHTVTNGRVHIDGDSARLMALVEAQHVLRADPSRHLLLKNWYDADLKREAGTWHMARVRIDNVWFEGEAAVLFG